MAASHDNYSMELAYQLGDDCQKKILTNRNHQIKWYFAAKLCYTLVTMKRYPADDDDDQNVNQQKLLELEQFRQQNDIKIPFKKRAPIPPSVLSILSQFYAPWLQDVKPKLIQRCRMHISVREDGLQEVFVKMTARSLDVDSLRNKYLQKHLNDIAKWEGPSFQYLTLRTTKNKMTDDLSVIYDSKGYEKRCNNSQEDWFKHYNGIFLAECIKKAAIIFGRDDASKAQFGFEILDKKIKFTKSKPTCLIPNSWLFGTSDTPLLNALTGLLDFDKTQFKGSKKKPALRKKLMDEFKVQCDIICDGNDEIEMKECNNFVIHDSCSMIQIPQNISLISSTYNATPSMSTPFNEGGSYEWVHMQPPLVNADNNDDSHPDQYHNAEQFQEFKSNVNATNSVSFDEQLSAPLGIHHQQQYIQHHPEYTAPVIDGHQRNNEHLKQLSRQNQKLKEEMFELQQLLNSNNGNNGNHVNHQQMRSNLINVSHLQQIINHGGTQNNIGNNGHFGNHQQIHSNNVSYSHQSQMMGYNGNNCMVNDDDICSCDPHYQQYINHNTHQDVIMNDNHNHQHQYVVLPQNASPFQSLNQNNSQQMHFDGGNNYNRN